MGVIISSDYPDYKLIIFGDPTTASDVSTHELYNLSQDENEQTPLGVPSSATLIIMLTKHYLQKDLELSPTVEAGDTIYLHLEETSGPSSAPRNPNLAPTSVNIDGASATYLGRYNQTDIYNRFWVKCTLPDTTSAPYISANVTFTNVPIGNATRVLNVTEIIIAQ